MTAVTAPGTSRAAQPDAWAPEAVWAVGRFPGPDGPELWPSTRAERASAMAAARRRLTALGVGSGDRVGLVSLMSEGVQLVPYEDALRAMGAVITPADATVAEGGRVASIARQPRLRAMLGVTADTLDGLAELGEDLALLGEVPVLVSDWAAAPRLAAAGLAPLRWSIVGPVLAVECPARSGAHVDGEGWHVASRGGEVTLTPRLPHHGTGGGEAAAAVRSGVRAAVVTGPCPCGSAEPRIMLG